MLQTLSPRISRRRLASFTLIELLAVMGIIAILSGLVLMAAQGVLGKAARSRATSEIQAISSALESYKADNGAYPALSSLTIPYSLDPTTYQTPAEALYLALAGHTSYTDTPVAGVKSYLNFKANQLGNTTTGAQTYFKDPFNYPYGYSTGATNIPPYNGTGFFDLWSTGGKIGAAATDTSTWITNWK